MEDLNAASMSDVKGWFKAYYGPSNAVLVLGGRHRFQRGESEGSEVFRRHPSGPPIGKVPQARIYKVWNVPQYGADADYLDLVSECLAQGKVSPLYKRLVYDDQIATDASAPCAITKSVQLKGVQGATPAPEDLKSAARRWLSDGVYILEVHPFPTYKTASNADQSKMPET